MEAGRDRQDGRRAEQRHRLQEGDERPGKQRRQGERDGDAPRRGPGAAAENGGCVFEVAGNAVKCVRDQHEDVRKRIGGDYEDHARERIDVEEVLVRGSAGRRPVDLVEQPAVRRRQQLPGNRAEKGRRHERSRDQRAHGAAQRHIRARDEPTHGRGEGAADDARAGRQDERRRQRIEECGIGDESLEIVEGKGAIAVDQAEINEPRHRQEDQHAQERRKENQDRRGKIDSLCAGGAQRRQCDAHVTP